MGEKDQPFRTDEGLAAFVLYLPMTVCAIAAFVAVLVVEIDSAEAAWENQI